MSEAEFVEAQKVARKQARKLNKRHAFDGLSISLAELLELIDSAKYVPAEEIEGHPLVIAQWLRENEIGWNQDEHEDLWHE